MPTRRLPQTILLAQTAELAQTILVPLTSATLLHATRASPQIIADDQAAPLRESRSPQTRLSPQMMFCAHAHDVPPITVCTGTELRSHQSPERADVSIALPSAMAPCALISPAP